MCPQTLTSTLGQMLRSTQHAYQLQVKSQFDKNIILHVLLTNVTIFLVIFRT